EAARYQLRCARLFQGFFPGGSRHGAGDYAVPTPDRRYNSVRHIVQGFKWTGRTEFTVVSLSPKLDSARGVHELRVDAKSASPFANASFDHVACAQFAADRTNICRSAFVGHRGVVGHDLERRKARERGRYVFG